MTIHGMSEGTMAFLYVGYGWLDMAGWFGQGNNTFISDTNGWVGKMGA
jgi:hypothetical protein